MKWSRRQPFKSPLSKPMRQRVEVETEATQLDPGHQLTSDAGGATIDISGNGVAH